MNNYGQSLQCQSFVSFQSSLHGTVEDFVFFFLRGKTEDAEENNVYQLWADRRQVLTCVRLPGVYFCVLLETSP